MTSNQRYDTGGIANPQLILKLLDQIGIHSIWTKESYDSDKQCIVTIHLKY